MSAKSSYLRQIRGCLPCSGKTKTRLLQSLSAELDAYLSEHPKASRQELALRFGQPSRIAADCVVNTDTAELLSAYRLRRTVILCVTAVLAAIVISWTGTLLWVVEDIKSQRFSYNEIVIEDADPTDDPSLHDDYVIAP